MNLTANKVSLRPGLTPVNGPNLVKKKEEKKGSTAANGFYTTRNFRNHEDA
jgi:hypothetical protein